jgi:uncharacterized surface anchored protein
MQPHRFTLAIVLTIWGMLVSSQAVNACSCVSERPVCEKFGYSTAVFLGKAIGGTIRESGKDENGKRHFYVTGRVTFQIEEAFSSVKGHKIVAVQSGGPCGTGFRQEGRYLIFASGETVDQLGTSMCSGNRPVEEASENLQFLRTLPPEGSGAKLYGEIKKDSKEKDAEGNRKTEGLSRIKLTIKSSNGETLTAETDQQGKYEITNLKPGEYEIEADLPDGYKKGEYKSGQKFSVKDRGCANIRFWAQPDNRIVGRVVEADGTIPKKVRLVLVDAAQKDRNPSMRDEVATAYFDAKNEWNKDGRFEFGWSDTVEPGEYLLGVNISDSPDEDTPYAPTYYPGVEDRAQATVLTVGLGTVIDDIVFQLPPKLRKHTVRGVIVWPDGRPITNAEVYLQDETRPDRSINGFHKTDAQGRFTLSGYVGFNYEIIAYAEKYPNAPKGKKQEMEAEPYKIKLTNDVAGIKIVLTKEKKKDE